MIARVASLCLQGFRMSIRPLMGLCARVAFLLAFAVPAWAAEPTVDVLIGYRQANAPGKQGLLPADGSRIVRNFKIVPAAKAKLTRKGLAAVLQDPNVALVEADMPIHIVDAELDAAWGVKHIGAGVAH